MRLLVNHSNEDRPYLQTLIPLMKAEGLTGVASNKSYTISSLQEAAKRQGCKAILLSNTETLAACLGEEARLSSYRGTRINYTIPVIVVNPLEHTHTVNHGRFLLQKDLEKFRRITEPVQPFSFVVLETAEQMESAQLMLESALLISLDIETNEKLQITCISYAALLRDMSVVCYVLPLVDFGVDHFRDDELYAFALCTMRDINRNPVPKVAFNGQYDATYLITYHAEPHHFTLDPMILGWCEYSELPRSLEFNASLCCYDYFYWKDEADKAKSSKSTREYWAYCAKDSWYTLRCLLEQMKTKPAYAFTNYSKIFRLVYPALYAAFEGIRIDETKRLENRQKALDLKLKALSDLQTMSANPTFNPGSWQQVAAFIYDTVGASRIKGAPKAGTDEKTLNMVAIQHPLLARIIDEIVTYRGQAKLISTYFDFAQKGGRLLYAIDPSGTDTGRSASSASAFWVGTQIQNIPRDTVIKDWLIADDGYILIEADKSKSEARCVGYMAQSLPFIEAIEDPIFDFYKKCAAMFFNLPYEKVTKELRNDVAKHIVHGSNYVMGPEPFIGRATPKRLFSAMAQLRFPIRNLKEFAKYLLSLYHKPFPEIRRDWYPEIKAEIQRTHMLVSPLGWTRYFFGDINKHHSIFRSAVAHGPQNISVELINQAYYQVYKRLVLPSGGAVRLKAQVHDSIFLQVKEEQLLETAAAMKLLMDIPATIHGRTMRIPTDFKVGKSWGDMRELTIG